MAEIINFAEVVNEQNAYVPEDDLKPMEEWDGKDWEGWIDGFMAALAEANGGTKWDQFAEFMKAVLSELE